MQNMTIGKLPERLKKRRKLKEMSIRTVAELAGVSPRQYAKYERLGEKGVMPPIDKLLAICNVLDCTVEEILHQEGTVHTILGEPKYIRTRRSLLHRLDSSAEFNFFVLSALNSSDDKLQNYNEMALLDAERSGRSAV